MKRHITQKKVWTLRSVLFIVLVASVGAYLVTSYVRSRSDDFTRVGNISISTTFIQQDFLPKTIATAETEPAATAGAEVKPTVKAESISKYPITYTHNEASSLTVVVNKKHRLPSDYEPQLITVRGAYLRSEAANALGIMLADAEASGISVKIISSYRSYSTQVSTYNRWVAVDGQVQADRTSARPGHSEHQTGLAVDLGVPDGTCDLLICFGDTTQGQWLAQNAPRYGFIIRYESDTEAITGYQYEPWHLRYVGVEIAQTIVTSGLTLDQYYGVEAGGYE